MIKVYNLTKTYNKTTIFNNFNYLFKKGKLYLLTNENGTGKTTFFKCLLNEIKYQGIIIDNKLNISYLPDKVLFPSFVSLDCYIKMFVPLYDKNKYNELLDIFQMTNYKKKNVTTFSKGMRQKTLIIKTFLENSEILLFDEPLAGLDKLSRINFIDYLQRIIDNKIILIATHYKEEYQKYITEEVSLV